MRFGLLYEIEVPRPWTERSQYDGFWNALEQAKVAEQAGFEYVWCVEHHFLDQFSISSAPEVWLTAVAQHTSTMRIGHGVVLLPFGYNHPIRVAERAAVLDIMSNGRLEMGTGRSASALELQGFGIDPSQTRAQWDEALHMIPKMWMQDEFSWESELITIPTRNVLPKPLQRPHPPLWVAGTQPATGILAGERGCGFLHFSLSDPTGMDEKVQSYRAASANATPAGAFVNNQFAAFSLLFCGSDDDDAQRRGGPGAVWYSNLVETVYQQLANLAEDESYAWYRKHVAESPQRERDVKELIERRSICVGGPRTCNDFVDWYASQGVDQLIFLVQAGHTTHDDIVDSLRRFGAEVIAPRRARP